MIKIMNRVLYIVLTKINYAKLVKAYLMI